MESRPPRTAATTIALRDATQRWASGWGRSARVSTLPSGASTRRTGVGEVIIIIGHPRKTNTRAKGGAGQLRWRQSESILAQGDRLIRPMVKLSWFALRVGPTWLPSLLSPESYPHFTWLRR